MVSASLPHPASALAGELSQPRGLGDVSQMVCNLATNGGLQPAGAVPRFDAVAADD